MKSYKGEQGIEDVWRTFSEFPANEVPMLCELDLWKHHLSHESAGLTDKLRRAGARPSAGTFGNIGLQFYGLRSPETATIEPTEANMEHEHIGISGDTYTTLMPGLRGLEHEKKALTWRQRPAAEGCPPRTPEEAEELGHLLLAEGSWDTNVGVKGDIKSGNVSASTTQGGIKDDATEAVRDDKGQADTLQSFVGKLDEKIGVSHFTPSMDDHTCARFFATSFFSVDFVLDGLALIGITQIGPLSIREVMRRTIKGSLCDIGLSRQHFDKMKSLGITCDLRYARYLEHLTNAHKAVLLHNVVTCGDDPGLFDDLEYQEKKFQSSDPSAIDMTRQLLFFEPGDREVEIRNILLRAGLEDIEAMIAAGIPITEKTRKAMSEATFIDQAPWISETKQRALIRLFVRLPYIGVLEWRTIIQTFMYLTRQHIRRDLEAMLLSLKNPHIFDFRTMTDIIRWYLRLGSLGPTTRMDTMLGGVKVLAALRDIGLVKDIQGPCEANLASLFGKADIFQAIDLKKRFKAQSIGNCEDFVIAIRKLYDEKMWHGMTPTEVKKAILARAKERRRVRIARHTSGEEQQPTVHTGKFNPGKTWSIKKRIIGGSLSSEAPD